jgi:hypothetical protein
MRVELRTFLAEGRLGTVQIGMTREEVLALAGEPAKFARGNSMLNAGAWVNGKVTFWFTESALERIGVYYAVEYPANKSISYDALFPEHGATLAGLSRFMRENEIVYSVDEGHIRHRVLVTKAGVQISAGSDDVIDSIVYPAVEIPKRRSRSDA